MILEREQYHQHLFLIAAIWNWFFSILLVLPRLDQNFFTALELIVPNTMIWYDSLIGLVFIFGLGFYLVSQNRTENHGLIMIAILAKFWIFIVDITWFLLEQLSIGSAMVAIGDLVFGILFLEDLRAIRKVK